MFWCPKDFYSPSFQDFFLKVGGWFLQILKWGKIEFEGIDWFWRGRTKILVGRKKRDFGGIMIWNLRGQNLQVLHTFTFICHLFWFAILMVSVWHRQYTRDIWKCTVEKSRTNATNVTLHPLGQAIWGHIWKYTVGKSRTNATNVILHPHRQAIWGDILKHTVEKSQTTAINVTMHLLVQMFWGHIWKHTVEKVQQM